MTACEAGGMSAPAIHDPAVMFAGMIDALVERVADRVAQVVRDQLGQRQSAGDDGAVRDASDPDELLTIARCCELADCSDDFLRREIGCGRLPHARLARRAIRVRRADFQTWIDERIETPTVVPLRRVGGGGR